nr:DELLA protein RGL1-like [Ipomoea batatas]
MQEEDERSVMLEKLKTVEGVRDYLDTKRNLRGSNSYNTPTGSSQGSIALVVSQVEHGATSTNVEDEKAAENQGLPLVRVIVSHGYPPPSMKNCVLALPVSEPLQISLIPTQSNLFLSVVLKCYNAINGMPRWMLKSNEVLKLGRRKYIPVHHSKGRWVSMFMHPYASALSALTAHETRDVELVQPSSCSSRGIDSSFYFAEALKERIDRETTGRFIHCRQMRATVADLKRDSDFLLRSGSVRSERKMAWRVERIREPNGIGMLEK